MALKTYLAEDLDLRWNLAFGVMQNAFITGLGYTFLNASFNRNHPAVFFGSLLALSLVFLLAMKNLKLFIPIKVTVATLVAFAITMIIITALYYPAMTLTLYTALDSLMFYSLAGIFILQLYIATPLLTLFYGVALRLQGRQH